ncbi:hypothetical protein [Blastococcus sp. TF02A-35]|uniref:hypothetical protein n=1 Tax=Blastococcus sp. TF02A-35 TaxID=2559612 RepID=UPI001073DC11|nr:hypothetical protein [Blastococcus sp. TF02A_35]TFV52071.1 hypothetical protein E4P43_07440 [Blastococcus sp. TF02A_35]
MAYHRGSASVSNSALDDLVRIGERAAEGIDPTCTVFISGSLVEGIGNESSDLDVFIIDRPSSEPQAKPNAGYDMGDFSMNLQYVDKTRLDIETWSRTKVQQVTEAIRSCDLEDVAAAVAVPTSFIDMAHRIRIGVPIQRPEDFQLIQAAVPSDRLARLVANRFLVDYFGLSEDAVGAIAEGDYGTAMLTSQWTLGAAVDAFCASKGHTNPKPKWRFAKLRALGETVIAERYLEVGLDRSAAPVDVLATSKRRLRTAAEIVQSVQDNFLANRVAS